MENSWIKSHSIHEKMNPKVSILIVSLQSRQAFRDRLLAELQRQFNELPQPGDVEIVLCVDNGEKTTGEKRNMAVQAAKGEYVCQADDDDYVSPWYVKSLLEAANSGMDCASLIGLYFINGVFLKPFLHSNKYEKWWEDSHFFYRSINHLNMLKRSIALQVPYPDQKIGEDGVQSERLKASGLIQTEYEIKKVLYYYYDRTKLPGQ